MFRQKRKAEKQRGDGERGQWASKTEYLLVAAGNVVGLGNLWRFPYLCYKNGGGKYFSSLVLKAIDGNINIFKDQSVKGFCTSLGAFLVPYGLFAVVCGVPLFLLETSIGQYTQEGFITCWKKLCPLAQGWMIYPNRFKIRRIKNMCCCCCCHCCCFIIIRNWIWTIGDETLRVHLHHSPSLGSTLPGVLFQISPALGHL